MKKALVIGMGRVGSAFNREFTANGMEICNVSSQSTFMEIQRDLIFSIQSFSLIIWAARDAGIPTNPSNSSTLFYELLHYIDVTGWNGFFVFTSSAGEIYGEVVNPPARETDPIFPISKYGLLKAKHETLVSDLARKNSFQALIIRVSNIYEIKLNDPGIVGALLRSLLNSEHFELQGGNQIRDFITIDDLATAVVKLVALGATGIFNIASGQSISINELVSFLEAKTLNSIFATRIGKVTGIANSNISVSKLEELLNWKPKSIMQYIDSDGPLSTR